MGCGEGHEEAEEGVEGGGNAMAVAEPGREFAVGSSRAFCHNWSDQHCALILFTSMIVVPLYILVFCMNSHEFRVLD